MKELTKVEWKEEVFQVRHISQRQVSRRKHDLSLAGTHALLRVSLLASPAQTDPHSQIKPILPLQDIA